MFRRNLAPVWVGIVLLSGMFLLGQGDWEPQQGCVDNDGDTYYGFNSVVCPGGDDCDDSNPDVNPGAQEGPFGDLSCSDMVDNDCDWYIDTGDNSCCECIDNDSDGYGDPACENCTYDEWDCDDTSPDANPALTEGPFGDPSCSDTVDNDCDWYTDAEDWACCECIDNDGDGYGDPACENCTYDEWDCDDTDANANPGGLEDCANGIDDDCDGRTDGEDWHCPCVDDDGDGYGIFCNPNCTYFDWYCYWEGSSIDCNDTNPDVNPGVQEGPFGDLSCSDTVDNDCDGESDIEDSSCCQCMDNDGDGYGDPACENCTYDRRDCDDGEVAVNPGAPEDCTNGVDDDCDGLTDYDDTRDCCRDLDGDGYGDPASTVCDYAEFDCDDSNSGVNPGGTEGPSYDTTCGDGLDNDCDGELDGSDTNCIPPMTCADTEEAFWAILDNLMTNYWSAEDDGTWLYNETSQYGFCGHYDVAAFSTELLYQLAMDPELSDPLYTHRADRTVEYAIAMADIGVLLQELLSGGDVFEAVFSLPALVYGHRYYSGPLPYAFEVQLPIMAGLGGMLLTMDLPALQDYPGYSLPVTLAYAELFDAYTLSDEGSSLTAAIMAQQAFDMLDLTDRYWVQETEDSGYYFDPDVDLYVQRHPTNWAFALQALALAYQASGSPFYLERALDLLNSLEDYWVDEPPWGYCDSHVYWGQYCEFKSLLTNHLMAKALLILYDATEDPVWFERAQKTLEFMTDPTMLIEDPRFPGFSILAGTWSMYDGTGECSCPGCNFATLAAMYMSCRLEGEGPSGVDPILTCPIATSALGTSTGSRIEVLRHFRDTYLWTHSGGRKFIDSYYKYSPPIAEYLAEREWLKSLVRILLLPVIGFVWLFV